MKWRTSTHSSLIHMIVVRKLVHVEIHTEEREWGFHVNRRGLANHLACTWQDSIGLNPKPYGHLSQHSCTTKLNPAPCNEGWDYGSHNEIGRQISVIATTLRLPGMIIAAAGDDYCQYTDSRCSLWNAKKLMKVNTTVQVANCGLVRTSTCTAYCIHMALLECKRPHVRTRSTVQ